MKTNWLHKYLAAILAVAILLSCGPSARGLQSRVDNFSDDYQLTGYGPEDMIAIAMAQLGKTGKQLGYTEEWCCDFISDCAILSGQTDAIPAVAYCAGLYNAILSAGGKKTTSSPKPGDICFINWDGGRSMKHVELVYKVEDGMVYTIGGNTGGGSGLSSRCVYLHDPLPSKYIVTILQPNYQVLDTSYVTKCTSYATYCTIEVTAENATFMSQPCTQDTDPESQEISTAAVGKTFTAVKVLKNTLGQLWYGVKSGDDTHYLSASQVKFIGPVENMLSISGETKPETMTEGDSFSIRGKVIAKGLPLSSVLVQVKKGDETVLEEKDSTKASSCNLKSSSINKNMKFGSLKPGEYEYIIIASVKGYYVDDNGSLETFKVEQELCRWAFTVKEHVCKWTFSHYGEKHPHYAVYRCSGCGDTKKDKKKTTEMEDCETCFPEPENLPPMLLTEENQLMQFCFHPFFADCVLCCPENSE